MQCPITFSERLLNINSFDEKYYVICYRCLFIYLCKILFSEIWSNKKHLVEHIKFEKLEEQRGKVVPTFYRFLVNSNGHELSIFSE